ncbi:MAG: hypothetical protein HZC22_03530 [Rhodocyclales bacterium]|nr:hypothetical protein [Rhodocyclales bacterium]
MRTDERLRFTVSIDQVTPAWLTHQLLALEPAQELALESKVRVNGAVRHIPMLDFRGMTKGQLTAIMEVFPSEYAEGLHVYFSGRSYHAYFATLLTPAQWIRFMGSALLCNTPSDPSVVDQRWVGHRLISGYSALRWSRNSPHYRSYPQRIQPEELDDDFQRKRSRADVALDRIEGVQDKGHYYESLVNMALRDLSIEYQRAEEQGLPAGSSIGLFVKQPNGRRWLVEVAYSDRAYLPKEIISRLRRYWEKAAQDIGVSNILLVTNTELDADAREALASAHPYISVIERTVSLDGLISSLKRYFRQ